MTASIFIRVMDSMIDLELLDKINYFFEEKLSIEEIEILLDRGIIKIYPDWLSTDKMLQEVTRRSGNFVKRLDETHILIAKNTGN